MASFTYKGYFVSRNIHGMWQTATMQADTKNGIKRLISSRFVK